MLTKKQKQARKLSKKISYIPNYSNVSKKVFFSDEYYASLCEKLKQAFGVEVGDTVETVAEEIWESHCFEIKHRVRGTVFVLDSYGGICILLDKHEPQLKEWENCIFFENQDHLPECFKQDWRKV